MVQATKIDLFIIYLQFKVIIIKLMIDYRSKLLAYSPKPVQRTDEWSLINQHKFLQDEKAKIYQQKIQEQKRRQLKQQLDQQVQQRNNKQFAIKHEDNYYAEIIQRQVRSAKEEEERKRRQQIEKRRQMEGQNRLLFGSIVDNKIREAPSPTPSLNIGVQQQQERMMMVEQQRRHMIDELDKQIQQKQQQKMEMKREQLKYDNANLEYQLHRFDSRNLHKRTFSQNQYVYNYYQQLVEKSKQKQQEFQRLQVQEAAKRKQALQLSKLQENTMNKRYLNRQMKQILDQQVRIKDQLKAEEERVNPQQLTYGTIGRMLDQKQKIQNKQRYFQQLKQQIEEKQKRQQAEKFMNDEEYKINLNQLNRAIQGKYTRNTYVDRSIHALSENHRVDVSQIDAHLNLKPEAEAARKRLQDLKARNGDKPSVSLTDAQIRQF